MKFFENAVETGKQFHSTSASRYIRQCCKNKRKKNIKTSIGDFMKINFGVEEFKLLKDLKSFEENIYSNGESFIIYDYNKNIVLIETLTDLLDYFNINDNREDVIYEIKESYKKLTNNKENDFI